MIIEELLRNFLSEKLAYPVLTEIPDRDIPEQFYLIEKTGGSISNHIERSTITIQSYGSSLYDSSVMNEQLKYAMEYNAISIPEIVSIDLDGDYNFTDTTEKKYRYQAVFDIIHYELFEGGLI